MSKYTRTRTRFRVLAADGTILNHGWPTAEAAERDAARYGSGAYVEMHTYEVEVAAYERVLIDSGIPEADWPELLANMQRMLNMAHDAGRPSDAMRSAVWAYKNRNR